MLLVTNSAKAALKTKLDNIETQPGQCARIRAASGGRFAIALDVETPGDQVVTHGETKVLVVDSGTAEQLDGMVLDYRDSGEGPELTLLRKEESEQTGK